jgi:cell division protein FtsB
MKLFNLILSVYFGIILSSLLVFCFGEQGLAEYEELARKKEILSRNIESLKEKNEMLNRKLAELNSNPQTIRLLARELGYYQSDEDLVHIQGYAPQNTFYEAGTIIRINQVPVKRNLVIKAASLLISLVFCAVITLKNGAKTRRT